MVIEELFRERERVKVDARAIKLDRATICKSRLIRHGMNEYMEGIYRGFCFSWRWITLSDVGVVEREAEKTRPVVYSGN